MVNAETLTREEALEGLLKQHTITFVYDMGEENEQRFVRYRINQYTLKDLMPKIAQELHSIISFPCETFNRVKKGWEESFVSINLDNVLYIKWPDEIAQIMHKDMSTTIEDAINEAFPESEENNDDE